MGKIYKLWHATDEKFFSDPSKSPWAFHFARDRWFSLVALVNAENLDEVFDAGNSEWKDPRLSLITPNLEEMARTRHRRINPMHSTTIGDVIELEGKGAWVVTPNQWLDINDQLFNPLARKYKLPPV